jgi:N-acetyl-anhydromuramyl-L-alanine amidase AmpD
MSVVNFPIRKIFIHCSASPHRGDTAEAIHRWHKERGWPGIGYHYVIDEFGNQENGRPEYWVGTHVKKHNRNSIGICLIGTDFFTEAQWKTLRALVVDLRVRYPGVEVLGHYEVDPGKTCPNFDVPMWLAEEGLTNPV